MDTRTGTVEAVLKESSSQRIACNHRPPGATVRTAKQLEQYLDIRRTDHPGWTAPAADRCSVFVAWGVESPLTSVHKRAEKKNQKLT